LELTSLNYLKMGNVLTLVLILSAASMVFSITAVSLLSFYNGFAAYVGGGDNIIAVYDRKSSTPFTGLVPTYLADRIGMVNGVLASSPEMLIPCLINSKALFLRGVVPEEFLKLNQITILEGEMLRLGDFNSIIIGKNVAEKIGLKTNDSVMVYGVLADRYVELNVKGIFESKSPMDDEIIVPIYIGQWLRGTDYNHVTLIRVKVDRLEVAPEIFEEVAKAYEQASAPPPAQPKEPSKPLEEIITPRALVRFKIENIGVSQSQRFMESYISRYGVTRETLLVFSITVLFFSSLSVASAAKTLIIHHRGEISILRSLGMSKRLLKRDLLIRLLPWSILASLSGVAFAATILMLIQRYGSPELFSHMLTLQIDPTVAALDLILIVALVSVTVLRMEVEP